MIPKLLDFWHSIDHFLSFGLGSMVAREGRAVSLCFSGYVDGQRHAVASETLPDYRRQGLAKLAAATLMEQYHLRGIRAHWDVMPNNYGALAVAEAIGFIRQHKYPVFSFELNR